VQRRRRALLHGRAGLLSESESDRLHDHWWPSVIADQQPDRRGYLQAPKTPVLDQDAGRPDRRFQLVGRTVLGGLPMTLRERESPLRRTSEADSRRRPYVDEFRTAVIELRAAA
jgi:hypothetical protein